MKVEVHARPAARGKRAAATVATHVTHTPAQHSGFRGARWRFHSQRAEYHIISRAEYVHKHVRSIWTLPDIISTDSYAWALGLAATSNVQRANDRNVGEGGPNNSKRGDWR